MPPPILWAFCEMENSGWACGQVISWWPMVIHFPLIAMQTLSGKCSIDHKLTHTPPLNFSGAWSFSWNLFAWMLDSVHVAIQPDYPILKSKLKSSEYLLLLLSHLSLDAVSWQHFQNILASNFLEGRRERGEGKVGFHVSGRLKIHSFPACNPWPLLLPITLHWFSLTDWT